MHNKPLPLQRRRLVIACGLTIVLTLTAIATGMVILNRQPTTMPDTTKVTLTGELTCLPHKDSSGPQTQECAMGLHADDGRYYALRDDHNIAHYQTGKQVKASGVLTAPTDTTYDIVGIFTVESQE